MLGREFSYRLLRDVAEMDEPALHVALERLAEAGILFAEGAPPQATYRFKHALIQDAAHESLLKSRRQPLHRRAAEFLRDVGAEPEAIAHHFTQAGIEDHAIEYWGKAGDQALRRSAFQEAIAHLGKAIEMADRAGGSREAPAGTVDSQRLKLQTSYSQALMLSRGFASEEVKAAFAHARELAKGVDNTAVRFDAYFGQWAGSLLRGELQSAQETAEEFLREAEKEEQMTEAAVACRILGVTRLFQGESVDARAHFDEALRIYDPERDRDAKFRFNTDNGAAATGYLALTNWLLGEAGPARKLIEAAIARAVESAHAPTLALAYFLKAVFDAFRDDAEAGRRAADSFLEIGRGHGLRQYLTQGPLFSSWASARLGDRVTGMAAFRQALAAYADQGNKLYAPFFQGRLAEIEATRQDAAGALVRIDEALALAQQTGESWTDALLHRIRGDILVKADPENPARAAEAYFAAIGVAREQGARSWGLRASLSLAKLYQSTARPADAHAVLAPALEGFAPTPEFPEITEAQVLLAALAEIDEVKVEARHRQRLRQLHVAYGNALIAARGIGAPETTEAFARAREAALGDKGAPERLAVHYGLWAGSSVRGDLPEMRAHAEAFLNDVEARPDSPEAGVAHRVAGLTCWFAGDYREALDQLQRALILFESGRDDDLAFRFGLDPGVAAMGWLAIASWPLGNVDRAISLIDQMQTRMANLTHVGTLANGRVYAALFGLLRGDRARVVPNTRELVRLAQEYDLNLWRAFGVFLEGWSSAASGASGSGLEGMRRDVELLRERNVLWFDGLLKMSLAEAEAQGGDPGRAVATLDEALGTVDRRGYRAFEAELHRARGDILFQRDPGNPAPAEGALLTAIAIAKQQGTRSFELRAALALARLFQSTTRPTEAHAVLAHALEGFSPTPEMPEIAEGQALLMELAETDAVKKTAASRQRRLQLQTSYSQAMMWSRGYGSDEAKAAFADAQELATAVDNAAERFDAYYGLFIGSLLRGELRSARETAEKFVREAEKEERITEAAAARRALGVACALQGDLAVARAHFEQALRIFDPDRDREAKFRFGPDVGAAATGYLALTNWLLGEAGLARKLMKESISRAIESAHAPTLANAYWVKAVFDAFRDDAEAGRHAAESLLEVSRGHGLGLYLASGVLFSSWARGRLSDSVIGMEELRKALTAYADQGNKMVAPLFQGRLAEFAEEQGAEGPLARIDEALALAQQTGERWTDAFLHRIRGDILLKADPENLTHAEDAYRTAIAIAREQGARTLGLQAALKLSNLHQSTGRPAEAHDILAPALEGFSPIAELPEIAEAQALLERASNSSVG